MLLRETLLFGTLLIIYTYKISRSNGYRVMVAIYNTRLYPIQSKHFQASDAVYFVNFRYIVAVTLRYILRIFPMGLTATPVGYSPTDTVAVTLFVAVSITETVLS